MNMLVMPPVLGNDGPINVVNAGTAHWGKTGPGSAPACGGRAHITYGREQFAASENKCARCAAKFEKSQALRSKLAACDAPMSANLRAAGIAFIDPLSNALFVKRSDAGDSEGHWAWPGGKLEGDEEPVDAAKRECFEELGMSDDLEDVLNDGPDPVLLNHNSDHGVGYTTFGIHVQDQFEPTLNEEHTEHMWAPMGRPPEPLHPGVKAFLEAGYTPSGNDAVEKFAYKVFIDGRMVGTIKVDNRDKAQSWAERQFKTKNPYFKEGQTITVMAADAALAFDFAPTQTVDADGRLHISMANISKANICPYIGSEIPDAEALGLDSNKVYYLLRDPEELAKGAASFNNLPILDEHIPHSADEPIQDKTIGTTGSEASFELPYLRNSLAFWVGDAIEDIRTRERRELSCSYRYRADMTPGVWQGARYDGVMRDIVGNHVALVKEGRAGSDVIVGDSKEGLLIMAKHTKKAAVHKYSAKGALAAGAVMVFLKPRLAADAKLDIVKLFEGVTAKNFGDKKQGLHDAIVKAATPLLAADAQLTDVMQLLDSVEKVEALDAEPPMQPPVDGTMDAEPVKEKATDSDEDDDANDEFPPKEKKAGDEDVDDDDDKKGKDEFPPKEKKGDDTMGKDAVNKLVKGAVAAAKAEMAAVRDAEKAVRPYVGELAMACDSADAVYGAALEIMGVPTKGIHPSAWPALLEMQGKIENGARRPAYATDAAPDFSGADVDAFNARFPGAARIGS